MLLAYKQLKKGLFEEGFYWEINHGENWIVTNSGGENLGYEVISLLTGKRVPYGGELYLEEEWKQKNKMVLVEQDLSFNKNLLAGAGYYQQRFNRFAEEATPLVYEVIQNQVLPPGTSDLESVDLLPPAFDDATVLYWTRKLKVDHLLNQSFYSLSNGQTRRTLLAMALMKQPELLLLHRPFEGLDAESRQIVSAILTEIISNGTQCILAADKKEVPPCFSHELELNGGKQTYVGRARSTGTRFSEPGTLLNMEQNQALGRLTADFVVPAFSVAFSFKNAGIRYGEKQIFSGLNWEVKRGDKWLVSGANGSGKSSLMSLVTGDHPQSYANEIVLFDRQRGTGESIWEIKKQIGYYSPELELYFPAGITLFSALASGLHDTIGLYKKPSETDIACVNDLMILSGLDRYKNELLRHLSKETRHWALVIRAFVKNPPVLILDEPAQGLTEAHVKLLRLLLESSFNQPGRTLVYISHTEHDIPESIDKYLTMPSGKITAVSVI